MRTFEERILSVILDKKKTRDAVVPLYFEGLKRAGMFRGMFKTLDPDWRRINEAIVERWSRSALVYIKERAWKGKTERAAPTRRPGRKKRKRGERRKS